MSRIFFLKLFLLFCVFAKAQDSTYYEHPYDTVNIFTEKTDTILCKTVAEALAIYQTKGFLLDSIRKTKTVPRLHVVNFPKEIKLLSVKDKKTIFTNAVLAAILRANNDIALERNEIVRLSKLDSLSSEDSLLLIEFKQKYYASTFDDLLHKADGLPPSLVLAQAINESGWGTSYFSIHANSIFGLKAPPGATGKTIKSPSSSFRTFVFANLEDGIKEYVMNMNRHRLYQPLRDLRYEKRKNGEIVKGKDLLPGIKRYSTRGSVYLNTISKFIDLYNLEEYDDCQVYGTEVIFIKF